jgi:hypothetical protein
LASGDFEFADAAFEVAHIGFDIRVQAVPQLRRSCSNEPQRFCAAYRTSRKQPGSNL